MPLYLHRVSGGSGDESDRNFATFGIALFGTEKARRSRLSELCSHVPMLGMVNSEKDIL